MNGWDDAARAYRSAIEAIPTPDSSGSGDGEVVTGVAGPVEWRQVPKGHIESWLVTLEHARTFIVSRQKMHPTGVDLYDDDIAQMKAALATSSPHSSVDGGAVGEGEHEQSIPARVESLENARSADAAGVRREACAAAEAPRQAPSTSDLHDMAARLRKDADEIVRAWDQRYAPDGVGAGVIRPAEVDTMREAADLFTSLSQRPQGEAG